MKNKSLFISLVSLSYLAVLILMVPNISLPVINTVFALAVGIAPILIAAYGVKDKKLASKTLQPYIVVVAFGGLKIFLDFLFTIILSMTGDAAATAAYFIIQIILAVAVFALAVTILVFFCLKKDAPVVGKFADKIVGIESEKPKKPETKTETEQDEIEEN